MVSFRPSALRVSAPAPYITYSILVSIGGLLFGLDTGCIGPITTMPSFAAHFGSLSSAVHGLVVSSILISASLTSFFAGSVADKIGRVRCIALGALIFALGSALEAAATALAMLFVGRAITGVGEGLFLSTLVVYVCEIAPARQRGMLASLQQFLVAMGICAGYFICYGTVEIKGQAGLSWRLPFMLQSLCAFAYGVAVFALLPQSPRWLKTKGRTAEAAAVWERLGVPSAEQEKDEVAHEAALERMVSRTEMGSLTLTGNQIDGTKPWVAIFNKDVRTRTLLAVFMMGFQQLSGIDGVLYYAPLLFQQAGLSSSTSSFLASGVSGLLMMLITIPAFLYADKWGRRTSTIYGGLVLASCMLIIGSLYASGIVHAGSGAARWVVVVMIYIFALTYCATWAVSFRIYASEIQPPETRAPATGLAQGSNWVINWIVAFTTPIFLSHSTFGIYFLFGTASLITVIVCAVMMPETRGRSLEDIDKAFQHGGQSTHASVRNKLATLSRRLRSSHVHPNRVMIEEYEM